MNKSENKIVVTPARIKALKQELYQLINVERSQVTIDIKAAREQGDLSENADYEAARERQAQIESRILKIQNILDHARSTDIHKQSSNKVEIGDQVEIYHFSSKKNWKVKILGRLDADPFKNIISNESPLAQAVLGEEVGKTVSVRGPEAVFRVKIIRII